MKFYRQGGGAKAHAKAIAGMDVPTAGTLEERLHMLQELGILVYSSATSDDRNLNIMISIDAEAIP